MVPMLCAMMWTGPAPGADTMEESRCSRRRAVAVIGIVEQSLLEVQEKAIVRPRNLIASERCAA